MLSSKLGISIQDCESLVKACGYDPTNLMSRERDEHKDSFGKWM